MVTARVYGVLSCWEWSLPGCMVFSVAGSGHCHGVWCPQLLGEVTARVYGEHSQLLGVVTATVYGVLSC